MSRFACVCVLASTVALLGSSATFPPVQDGQFDHAISLSRSVLQKFQSVSGAPGVQVAVAVDGRIVWSEGFGHADVERGLPVTTGSQFRIASISKLFTGTLTAKLAASGRLDLDRPIHGYVPDLPAAWRSITARMLVHHASGIAHYSDEYDGLDTTYYPTTQAALVRFRDRPLVFSPGTGIAYSSYAYTALALVIERVTGKSFLEAMQQELFAPLAMPGTVPDLQRTPAPGRTAFYDLRDDGTVTTAPYVDLSGRWAGSGYLSTAEDLVRFGAAHVSPGIIPAAALKLIPERYQLPDSAYSAEGFGWGPREDWDGRRMLWGDGGTPGARGGLLVYPDDGLVIAILTNARGVQLERGEFQALARLFLAAKAGREIGPQTRSLAGRWQGEATVGTTRLPVILDWPTGSDPGRVEFPGWRSLSIAAAAQLGDTTWLFPLDRAGMIPFAVTRRADSLDAGVARFNMLVRLGRTQ